MNPIITKEYATERLKQYYEAEEAILTGQRYKIGGKELQRAQLHEIRAGIQYWENKLAALESGRNPNAVRAVRVVPRDL